MDFCVKSVGFYFGRKISEDDFYAKILRSDLAPMVKVYLLSLPSLRTLASEYKENDFHLINKVRQSFQQQLAGYLEDDMANLLVQYPDPENYDPMTEDFVNDMPILHLT